jgi:hypothetical protein
MEEPLTKFLTTHQNVNIGAVFSRHACDEGLRNLFRLFNENAHR